MSESANCVEQREEQTELEEAGGAEVRRFKTGALSPLSAGYIFHRAVTQVSVIKKKQKKQRVLLHECVCSSNPAALNFHFVDVNAGAS